MSQFIGQGEGHANVPAHRLSLRDIVSQYEAQLADLPMAIEAYKAAHTAMQTACSIQGAYGGQVTSDRGTVSLQHAKEVLLSSAWKHVYTGLKITRLASASDKKKFERFFERPLPFTLENIRETFGDYILDPRGNMLRGLAEVFSDLDPAFRSHEKMKIGVKGLPKRVVITNVGEYCHGWGADKIMDMLKAYDAVCDRPLIEYTNFRDWMEGKFEDYFGLTIKRFKNGNAHIFFGPEALKTINKALSEYYGEVLPDCPEERTERRRQTSTAVSKDLAFYGTPRKVLDFMAQHYELPHGMVLEPSAGEGAILDWIKEVSPDASTIGVEVDVTRALKCINKGHRVLRGNFLEQPAEPIYDFVVMNPPFVGKHYQKHVDHAKKFLKPGGRLLAILPATAMYDHGYVDDDPRGWHSKWRDLPTGSFSESGTNVQTGIYQYFAPKD